MRLTCLIVLATIFMGGCQTTGELPPVSQIQPGVAEEGSLADEKLISDATVGIAGLLPDANITETTDIAKFVIQQPVGSPGSRAWREMWTIFVDDEATDSFLITFREDGLGAASFDISRMQ